jgi:hypothetical protein
VVYVVSQQHAGAPQQEYRTCRPALWPGAAAGWLHVRQPAYREKCSALHAFPTATKHVRIYGHVNRTDKWLINESTCDTYLVCNNVSDT